MKNSTNVKITSFLCAGALLMAGTVQAQEETKYGRLSGSYETNTIWYFPDDAVYKGSSIFPEDRIGSNNYLKLDYSLGKFSAGIQGDIYMPVLQGYSSELRGAKIVNKYASWTDENFFVTVGDFFDQYGSGLIFRAYEDRALGINSGVEGVRAGMNFGDFFSITAMMGRPRLYMEYAPTWLRGANATLSLSSLFNIESQYLAIEGSYLSQYDEARTGTDFENLEGHNPFSANMNAWSGRLAYEVAGFSSKVEIAGRSASPYLGSGGWEPKSGRAYLVELGYSGYGWGVSLAARHVDYMTMKLTEDRAAKYSTGIGNVLNYIPALTRIYTYSLANLDPYQVKSDGEKAAQLDVFYNIRRGTKLGGRYGTKLHVNAAIAYQPDHIMFHSDSNKNSFAYLDASFDFEKQWDKKWKTTLMFAFQRMRGEAATEILLNRYVVALDGLYKITPKQSLRLELQYLYAPLASAEDAYYRDNRDQGSWWAAQLEYNIAPSFSFFVSDMYNYKIEKVHYYSVGMSYSKSRTRIAFTYGRNRAGYVCSGGVCRQMPAYTGINLSITTSF